MTISKSVPSLCEACVQMGMTTLAIEPHQALLDRGTRQLAEDDQLEQTFRCADCNTIWVRHINKWGIAESFCLASTPGRTE